MNQDEEVQYKSSPPIAYFIWIVVTCAISILLFVNTFFWQAIVLALIFAAIGYVILCRNACIIWISKNSVKVRYYFPLMYEKKIIFRQNMVVEYDLGYYYYLSPEHRLGTMQLLYPCDTIFFYQINGSEKILYDSLTVYTSYYSFKLLRQHLCEHTLKKK